MELHISECIDQCIERARKAQTIFEQLTQEETDNAVRAVAKAIFENAELLAEMAVEETGMGSIPDKALKSRSNAKMIWHSLKSKKSKGIIARSEQTGITKIAKPMGIVAAITSCAAPITALMSNAMFSLKGGNAIIIIPHHKTLKCSAQAVELINAELRRLKMPENLIQITCEQSGESIISLISSADIVIADDRTDLLKIAYRPGQSVLCGISGNVQCIIDRDVDIKNAISKIIAGRAFDNGVDNSSEQSIICPNEMLWDIMDEFDRNGGYVIRTRDEAIVIRNAIFEGEETSGQAVGQSTEMIGTLTGISIPSNTNAIAVPAFEPGESDLLSRAKRCPVISVYGYADFDEAVEIARRNLEVEGKGHSVSIHSHTKAHIEYAGENLCASRFVINQICANSVRSNFYNYKHFINIARIVHHTSDNCVPAGEQL